MAVLNDPARRVVLLAALVAALAWAGSVLQGGFAYDDAEAIFENPVVTGELPLQEAFRRDYWHHKGDAGHYRPVATVSLRLDHAVWGGRAAGYHATNVLLQVLVVLLLGLLVVASPLALRAGAAGLLVFAAHPVLADAVAWISGRTSMLSAIGGLVALLAVVRSRRLVLLELGVVLGLLFGLLAKEDAVVFALPVLLLAGARSRRHVVAAGVGIVAALGVYLLLRAAALGSALPSAPHAPLAAAPLGERLLFAGRALLEGARLALLPVGYPPAYRFADGFHAAAAPGAWAAWGWGLWGAAVVAGGWAFVRGARGEGWTWVWAGASAALAALALLPVLQIVPAGEVFAPRFLYLPLLLGVPALGVLLARFPRPLLVLVVLACVVGAWSRARVYASRAAFSEAVIAEVPDDVAAWNDLGLAREASHNLRGAREAWGEAIRRRPGYSRAWTNLGRLALADDDLDQAERFFERAIEAGRDNAVAHVNLGSVLLRQERWADAESAYAKAANLAPGLAPAWYGLARARWRQGRTDAARVALARAEALAPKDEAIRELREVLGR